jgi:hypothetical protein
MVCIACHNFIYHRHVKKLGTEDRWHSPVAAVRRGATITAG